MIERLVGVRMGIDLQNSCRSGVGRDLTPGWLSAAQECRG